MGNNKKGNYSQKGKGNGKYRGNNSYKGGTNKAAAPESESSASGSKSYDDIRSNDINWWNKSPMYSDAVRVPFNRIYGDPIKLTTAPLDEIHPLEGYNAAVPGIMVIKYIPTIGSTLGGSNAPINRAFTSLYGDIYSKTTGAMQFQQTDLAMFVTAFSNIAGLIGMAKRILGVSQIYSGMNYYYPRTLLQSLGVDPDTVIGHQDELRMRLNDSILSFNNLKIPNFMDIYQRQFALAHNLYADEDNVQSQLYAFVPAGYYIYRDTESKLEWLQESWTMENLLTDIESTLAAWRNSSDLGLISGSVQRAFAENSLITLDYVTSADVVLPIVDRNISWQISNLTALDIDTNSLDITQNVPENRLIFEPKVTSAPKKFGYTRREWILNSYDGEVGDEFIMEATRLMMVPFDPDPEQAASLDLPSPNTELVINVTMHWLYRLEDNGDVLFDSRNFKTVYTMSFDQITPANIAAFMELMCVVSKFKNGPRIYCYIQETAEGPYREVGTVGDIYRYTTIDAQALKGLNAAALQSAYAITNL